jgi:hypothetical protein
VTLYSQSSITRSITPTKMRRFTVCLAVLSIVGALCASVMLDAAASRGQSKAAGKPGADAAKRNALLSTELTWTFGSKQQRGWYLYTPLIKRLINTKQGIATAQFALALSQTE